ncbi:putative ribonuclease h1 [Paratrimastix pyriformis]|uniref:ribonuclease H n=1 Tax=Paratrimastix pyriformis TaxID=342808 RepID=A0ABQ8ULL6_9EUKA|nr:putative ribonuclease h1 [Paratrimastix pyriformis]
MPSALKSLLLSKRNVKGRELLWMAILKTLTLSLRRQPYAPLCRCRIPAARYLCHKEDSPYQGKFFFTCAQRRCKFWQLDDLPTTATATTPARVGSTIVIDDDSGDDGAAAESPEAEAEVAAPKRSRQETPGVTTVFTDGSCVGNGSASATGGIAVYFGPADPRNIGRRLPATEFQPATNQRAELMALIAALQETTGPLIIKTDSKYSQQIYHTWLPMWIKKDKVDEMKNPDLIKALWALGQGRQVRIEHVRGHRGLSGNEAADRLANQGRLNCDEPPYTINSKTRADIACLRRDTPPPGPPSEF